MYKDVKLSQFITTVEIPIRQEIMIVAGRNIRSCVGWFKYSYENADSIDEKNDSKLCWLVSDWAESCEGCLETLFNDKGRNGYVLVMELKFNSIEQLNMFSQNLKQKVREGLNS